MENKKVIYFLAGVGTVAGLILAYNKFVVKKAPVQTPSIVK